MAKVKADELDTPTLLLDLPTTESNLLKMVRLFSKGQTKLRPHFKYHQCA